MHITPSVSFARAFSSHPQNNNISKWIQCGQERRHIAHSYSYYMSIGYYMYTYNVYIYYVWESARVRCVFSVVVSVCGFLFLFSQCFSLSVSGSVETCGCYISLAQSELRFDSICFGSRFFSSAPLFICIYIFNRAHSTNCCCFFLHSFRISSGI